MELAKDLLGQRLVRVLDGQRLAVRIVEVEAYLGQPDLAAHTVGGRRTPRNESMWQDGGTLYVYFTYGMHYCMNVVASRAEDPVAVLLRGGEPVEGIDVMQRHRPAAKRFEQLCAGPARLCAALAIDRACNGLDLVTSDEIFIQRERTEPLPESEIVTTTRVGVGYAGEWAAKPLRFYLRGNPHVSRK